MDRPAHEVLGVDPDASVDEAEDAYHRLLRQEHPDLHHGSGATRMAEAERRTRELNAAISAFRDGRVHADARARAAGVDGEPSGDPRTGAPSDGVRADGWDERTRTWTDPPREPSPAACPWCGRLFDRAVDLKDHVFDEHDLRIDPRRRGALFGGRLGRFLQKAAHLPLWGVIPLNVAFATVVGVVMTTVTDDVVGWWSAGVAMAPTAVVLLERLAELDL